MIKIVTKGQMRLIEKTADAAGISYSSMMQSAGRAVAEIVKQLLGVDTEGKRVAVLVGSGNNGGDGLVAAAVLKQETLANVACYLLRARPEDESVMVAARDAGVFVATAEGDQRSRVLRNLVSNADILVDAVLGTGARLPMSGSVKKALEIVSSELQRRRPASQPGAQMLEWPAWPEPRTVSGTKVVAVDCPSGLDCDTGEIDPAAIAADVTVTFAGVKHGQLRFPGAGAVGKLVVAPIGIPPDLPELREVIPELTTSSDVASRLPARTLDSHKGTYGRALVVAGSVTYTGAAVLAGRAAYRVGAGLVRMAIPEAIYPIVAPQLPEAVWVLLPHDLGAITGDAVEVVMQELDGVNAMLVGPGLGRDKATAAFIHGLLTTEHIGRKTHIGFGSVEGETASHPGSRLPESLIIDADGLNLLSAFEGWQALLPRDTIITPHVGEMSRLSGLPSSTIQADRIATARQHAIDWRCVVVLKGAFTVVADQDGRVAVAPHATDALATAGTGDVLAGCILGLRAQGLSPFDAAVAGVYLHGLAGVLAGKAQTNRATVASDVLHKLPEAIRKVESIQGDI